MQMPRGKGVSAFLEEVKAAFAWNTTGEEKNLLKVFASFFFF